MHDPSAFVARYVLHDVTGDIDEKAEQIAIGQTVGAYSELSPNVRHAVGPAPASPLPDFTWSSSAAAVAQDWANRCVYQHNPGRGTRGENIAASGPVSTTPETRSARPKARLRSASARQTGSGCRCAPRPGSRRFGSG